MKPPIRTIPNSQYGNVVGQRIGILLHYDGSGTDAGAMAWFEDPACKVSYNALVLDSGEWVSIAPWDKRAYHAGKCRPSSARLKYTGANGAFYGIAAATNDRKPVTDAQKQTIVSLCRFLFAKNGWPKSETWRISGHSDEAWPRGRKVDPAGRDKAKPILSVAEVREML